MKRFFSSILILVVVTILLLTNIVSADTHSYYWHSDVKYYISSSLSLYSATNSAISDWNSSLNTIGSSFDLVYGTSSTAKITFSEGYYGTTGTVATCSTNKTGTSLNSAHITYNRLYTNNYSSEKNRAVACHELGHAIGQSHTTDTSEISIMLQSVDLYYDTYDIYYPTNYDRLYLNYNY